MKNFDGKLLSIITVWLLILAVVVLAGCATIRCTEYASEARIGSVDVSGCQCTRVGTMPGNTTISLERCEITLEN